MKKTKLLSLILAMLMLTSSVFAAPVALPTVDSAQETEEAAQQHFPAAEAEVGAESLPEFKPGYNILTKTAEPLTFEGADFTGLSYTADRGKLLEFKDKNGTVILDNGGENYWRTARVVSSPVDGETNTALEISDFKFYGVVDAKTAIAYPSIRFNNFEHPANGRPTLIKFKTFVHDGDIVNSTAYRFRYNGYKGEWSTDYFFSAVYKAAEKPEWKQVAFEDNQSKTKLAALSWVLRAGTTNLTRVTGNTWWLKEGVVSPKVYVDDIMYIPYYEVTYMNGNTEVGKKYVLHDGNGNILTEFNPYTQGVALPENKSGWALTPNGEPVTSVALNNEDITLHAVAQYMDKTVAFFDFSSQENIKEWSFPKFKNGKEELKAADVVTSSDKENPLVGAENAVKATVWREKKADETLSYDAQIQLDRKMEIPAASINVIEIRAKAEKVTEMVNPKNKKETISATLDDSPAELFLHIEESNQYYQKAMKWKDATKDDNGWYTFTFEIDALRPSSNTNTTTWDQVVTNGYNVDILRFDPSNTDGTFYIDYIKLYGKTNDITPIALYAPENIEGVSFRVDPRDPETTGVRFRASMLNTTRENTRMTEYGWIVALEETLGVQELTHEFDAKARVEGKAFIRATGIDKIFGTNESENSTIFSAVVTGIPVQFADKVLAIRPYSFMNGGYIYGKTVLISPREAARRVKADDPDFYERNKDYMNSLLGTSQEEAE